MTEQKNDQKKIRLVLLGGFLGAGKTTLIGRLVEVLVSRGLRVGIITNDQGEGLIDSLIARRLPVDVEEVTGGCFCCKLEDFELRMDNLAARGLPDVVIAESVGSCTDLVATVLKPMKHLIGASLSIAPFRVLLDGKRAHRLFVGNGGRFHKDIGYIYRKQLEEAEDLIINKCDLLSKEDLLKLSEALEQEYSGKKILQISALEGTGLVEVFGDLMDRETSFGVGIDVDYEQYATGEAMLGWYNGSLVVDDVSDLQEETLRFIDDLLGKLLMCGMEVAHLKVSMAVNRHICVAQATGAENASRMTIGCQDLEVPAVAEVLVNLRAEGPPEEMKETVEKAVLRMWNGRYEWRSQNAFRPGKPIPARRWVVDEMGVEREEVR